MNRRAIRTDRVRNVRSGFAAIENRFLHEGFFASLNHVERSLYLFLVLAGDRQGVSYYSYDRICSILQITLDRFIAARRALIDRDLLATDGTRVQILSLPAHPVNTDHRSLVTQDDFEQHDPATIQRLIRESIDES